ncbi:MAG: hypothetical protein AAFV62_07775 [Pseudomonadota bacterium]
MTRRMRISRLWLGLGVVYAAFIAWHQPLRGPLSEDEVRATLGAQYAQIRESEDTEIRAFLDFFLTDDGRPFFMVNMNALPEQTPAVQKAARRYGSFMIPRLVLRASYPVMSTDIITSLNNSLGVDLAPVERLILVRYRSRRDFLEVVASAEFRHELRNKEASLDGWYAAPSTIGPLLSLPVIGLCVLLSIGVIGTLRASTTARPDQRDPGGTTS